MKGQFADKQNSLAKLFDLLVDRRSGFLASATYEVAMNEHEPFHIQLKLERSRRGWTQGKLAEKVGCDNKTIARWESEDIRTRTHPRSDSLEKLCEIFDKSVEEWGLLDTPDP